MPARDTVTYTCILCGRSGHRQFSPVDPAGPLPQGAYRCTNKSMCKDRLHDGMAKATTGLPKPTGLHTTARCLDCIRVWTVKDERILQRAVEAHELNKPGHQVQVTL